MTQRLSRREFFPYLAGAGLLLAGCGGGIDETAPLSSTLRTLRPGDEWVYAGVTLDGSTPVGVRDVVSALTNSPLGATLRYSYAFTIFNTTTESPVQMRQDPNTRNLLVVADANGAAYPEPVVALPGTWLPGYTVDEDYQAPPGVTVHRTFRIEGVEVVRVPAGTYRTWRTFVDEGTADAGLVGTYWYAPQIGNYVRAEITARAPAPQPTLQYRLELTRTNVTGSG